MRVNHNSKKKEETRRQKILEAALAVFVERGFAGASMSYIAKIAGVPQSLIYHYFSHKEELWRQAKRAFLNAHTCVEMIDEQWRDLPLEQFVEKFVRCRFDLYVNNPLVMRMMNWQRLEGDDGLSGQSYLTTSWLKPYLEHYQRIHYISANLNVDLLALWMTSSITAPLFDHYERFKGNEKMQQDYINMIAGGFLSVLKS